MVQEFCMRKKRWTQNMDEHTMLKTAKIPQLWVCKITQKEAEKQKELLGPPSRQVQPFLPHS